MRKEDVILEAEGWRVRASPGMEAEWRAILGKGDQKEGKGKRTIRKRSLRIKCHHKCMKKATKKPITRYMDSES